MLVIDNNHSIGDDQRLYSMLTNPSNKLELLSLWNCQLSSRAAIHLFTALKNNNQLKKLNIMDNAITDDACDAITATLQSPCNSFDNFTLYDNPLSSEAIINIVLCLKGNTTLCLLGLPECPQDIQNNVI